jgi:hypothetical protein
MLAEDLQAVRRSGDRLAFTTICPYLPHLAFDRLVAEVAARRLEETPNVPGAPI